VATRNASHSKRFYRAHETHYAPWVQQLVADAPLHLERKERIRLPAADPALLDVPLGQAIRSRASGRAYGDVPLDAVKLATLLQYAAGVRASENDGADPRLRRNVANSGNLGSVEIYPVMLNAAGIDPGIYHFDSVHHDLALLHRGEYRTWLRECVFFQLEFADAGAALILTSAFGRLKAKYGPRGYRLGLFDVGHVSQNVYLIATALGLEVCATAGFIDDVLDSTLDLDGLDTAATLIILIGERPRGSES
jgi:SagB-type dehydrogenase family enzyme